MEDMAHFHPFSSMVYLLKIVMFQFAKWPDGIIFLGEVMLASGKQYVNNQNIATENHHFNGTTHS